MNAEAPIEAISQPHAVEAEQSVIGLCMWRADTVADFASMLTADMFHDPLHADLYQCILDRWQAGEPYSAEFIMRDMRNDLRFAKGGALDLAYIQRLRNDFIVMDRHWRPDVAPLAGVIIEAAAKRTLGDVLDESRADLAHSSSVTAQEVVDRLMALGPSTMEGFPSARRREKSPKDSFIEYLYSEDEPFISTGLSTLDSVIGGFRRGNSIIVGGRPSMGKSLAALFFAYMAARRGEPTVFYSYEMSVEEITGRTVSLMLARGGSDLHYTTLMGKRSEVREIDQVKAALDHLEQIPLIIVDAAGMTIEAIRADLLRQKLRLAIKRQRLAFAVVDYLQLIAPTDGIRERIQQVGHISRGLKGAAKHADIPILTLSQLSRANEGRPDKLPQLSDLRESGDIEQDADTVIFAHRESYYTEREMKKLEGADRLALQAKLSQQINEFDAVVAKNRHGPVRTVTLGVDLATNRFWDIEQGAQHG